MSETSKVIKVLQDLIDSNATEIKRTERELAAMQVALLMLKKHEQVLVAKKKSVEEESHE